MLNPQPDDATLSEIYGETYFIGSNEDKLRAHGDDLKRKTAKLQLQEINAYIHNRLGKTDRLRLLEVGCGLGNFLMEARNAGFDIQGIDVSADAVKQANAILGEPLARACFLEDAGFKPSSFDIIVLADVIEHVRDPKAFMALARGLLKSGGIVFIAAPSLDSFTARLMGRHWMEFKLEHLYYFDRRTMEKLLVETGFEQIVMTPGRKVLSLSYIIAHFIQFSVPVLTPILKILGRITPGKMRRRHFEFVASGINVLACAKAEN